LKKTPAARERHVPEQLALVFDVVATSIVPVPGDDGRTRALRVGPEYLSYRLRRARRRSIGFQIDDAGLTVSAPRWVPLREIEAAITEKHGWIVRKQREWREWRERRRLPQVRFCDGGTLPFLGATLTLRLGAPATQRTDAVLAVGLPRTATEAQVRDAVQAWLQTEARRVLGERIALLATRANARYAGWKLSSARSQWGSCTHDGVIRLSWRLVHFGLPVIDYVVAHELAHLAEMNHSPRFWRVVAELLPGFEPAREEIRRFDIAALPL
jgi:predicted metal-dependent hydrolase